MFAALLVVVPAGVFHLIEQPLLRFGGSLASRWFEKRRPIPASLPTLDVASADEVSETAVPRRQWA